MTREEMKAQSATPQERQFARLRKRLQQLYRQGAFDRFIEMREDWDKTPSDPSVWERIEKGEFDALTEAAIWSIRPDIHKPLRYLAMKEVLKYTHTSAESAERLNAAAQITGITIHIEGYARGIPAALPEPETRKVEAEIVDADGDVGAAAISEDGEGGGDSETVCVATSGPSAKKHKA